MGGQARPDQPVRAVFARHRRIGELTRQCIQDLGLELFAHPTCASNTVTAIRVPGGIDDKELIRAMLQNENVVIAGGQERLGGQIVRIGHLGMVSDTDIIDCFNALSRQLRALGWSGPAAYGVREPV